MRTVRSPRVGDRLDAELPQCLMDALPQLSDSALDDAAQPLEDLEEHRWWILPLAPGVPERLIVGNERAFLTWFYEGDHVVDHAAITPEAVDEYLRTFAGKQGVLGSMGIYRAAFASID